MIFHPRSDWQSPTQPVVGPPMVLSAVDTIAIHYTAAPNLPDGDLGEDHSKIPPYLRSIQNDYTVNRGYSIGYNFAIDWLGHVWELRGFDIKCAANKDHNSHTIAILMLVDGNDPTTAEGARSVRELIGQAEKKCEKKLLIKGHKELPAATSCPGTGLLSQIHAGVFNPVPDPVVPPTPPPTDPPPITPPIIPGAPMEYFPLASPTRSLDTRNSRGPLTLGETITVPAPNGLPAGTGALAVNLTSVSPQAAGYFTAWQEGGRPNAAALNYKAGEITGNFAIVPVTTSGTFQLFSSGGGHVIVDVVGTFGNA